MEDLEKFKRDALDYISAGDNSPGSRKDCIRKEICVICSGPAKEFRSELDTREYFLSGLCQLCQDECFNCEVS